MKNQQKQIINIKKYKTTHQLIKMVTNMTSESKKVMWSQDKYVNMRVEKEKS